MALGQWWMMGESVTDSADVYYPPPSIDLYTSQLHLPTKSSKVRVELHSNACANHSSPSSLTLFPDQPTEQYVVRADQR